MAFFQEIKEQIGNLQPTRKDLRNLGLVFFIALGIVGSLLWWKGRPSAPWFGAAALVLGFWGLVWPSGLKPVYRVWMGLALVLNYFISRFILIPVVLSGSNPHRAAIKDPGPGYPGPETERPSQLLAPAKFHRFPRRTAGHLFQG